MQAQFGSDDDRQIQGRCRGSDGGAGALADVVAEQVEDDLGELVGSRVRTVGEQIGAAPPSCRLVLA